MVYILTHYIDNTHGIDLETHGIESVLLNHTHTRGRSVTRMRDFFSLVTLGGKKYPKKQQQNA